MDAEDRLHAECYQWFHNTYPQYRGLLCYNLNNSINAIQGNKNKALGLQQGRADLVLYWRGMAYHLEIKTPAGSQSKAQREWQSIIEANGFCYTIHRSIYSFIECINIILNS
jgi:hypothetical protein